MGSIAPQLALMAVNQALHDIHEARVAGADATQIAELEEALKAAYGDLADKAGAKVSNWRPSAET